jgi:DNA-binding transcriptional regulator YiaG
MTTYHYVECGLDNVFIEGMDVVKDHGGEETVVIPEIGNLHRVIAEGIITQPHKMSGNELRFLRSEMGMTQSNLAKILKVKLLTVSRWERDESDINDAAEMLIRLLAIHRLGLKVDMNVDQVSEKVNDDLRKEPIRISGVDPSHYHLLEAA